jgi:hypothetical protein
MTNDGPIVDDELLSNILESCRSLLPMTSDHDVAPGEVITVSIRPSFSEFPEKAGFAQTTSGQFEVDEVALRPWKRAPHVLQSRDRGDRTDLASVSELLRRVVLPPCIDLALTVRNISDAPHRFACAIASHSSVVDQREHLLRTLHAQRQMNEHPAHPSLAPWRLFHMMREGEERPGWWKEDHQRLVDLPETAANKIEAALARCADGSLRRDLRGAP